MSGTGPLLAAVSNVVLAMLTSTLLLALVRLVRGPSLPDRVVALDLIALTVVGFVAVYEIRTAQPVLLDAAIVLALIGFLSTVAFARYLERGARR
ncbi:MAG: pH regulation protein F [Armatimonadetes bacterium]|nr:pH regulation protein F [Armatimonadota bacterium]